MVYHSNAAQKIKLKKALQFAYKKMGGSPNIVCFENKAETLAWLYKNNTKLDIAFVDCSDADTGKTIVQALRMENLHASWVHVDGTSDNLVDLLLWRPSAKIDDVDNIQQVFAVIKRLNKFHHHLRKKNDFVFKYEGELIHIPYRNITYFESNGKKVTLYLRDKSKNYSFASKLDDIEAKLPKAFLRCHQSYLLNLDEVRRLDVKQQTFILNNNEEIPISRRRFTEAKERYIEMTADQ